jgi:lipopolysaccharide/colanic/teichoic acid biosynthesis glycosyltransferase
MYKFRTMCVDAEARLPQLAHLNAGGSRLIRIDNDPRVTRLGSFLRRTSLDELPQLVNVVRGEMSLVGPRPQSPDEVALYSEHQRERLAVPPGMTGLWQVTARDDPRFDEWIRLDLQYIRQWSLGLDLKILLKTPAVMVRTVSRSTGDLN